MTREQEHFHNSTLRTQLHTILANRVAKLAKTSERGPNKLTAKSFHATHFICNCSLFSSLFFFFIKKQKRTHMDSVGGNKN